MPGITKMMNQIYLIIFIISLITIVLSVVLIISLWKIFKKLGKKGWEALIPIYNIIVLLQICELPIIYLILLLIPFVNIYALIKIGLSLANKFNKSSGVGILCGLIPFIGLPLIAFSKEKIIEEEISLDEEQKEQVFEPSVWTNVPMEVDNTLNKTIETPLEYIKEAAAEIQFDKPIEEKNITIKEVEKMAEIKSEIKENNFSDTKTCTNCGAKLGDKAKGCFMCGKTF